MEKKFKGRLQTIESDEADRKHSVAMARQARIGGFTGGIFGGLFWTCPDKPSKLSKLISTISLFFEMF